MSSQYFLSKPRVRISFIEITFSHPLAANMQYRREHYFEYNLEQKGMPAHLRPVCIDMYSKCVAVCKALGRKNSLHTAYLITRFKQLLQEDSEITVDDLGIRSLPILIQHHVLWRKICCANGWKCLPPHSASEDSAAKSLQRCWQRRKRARADAAFKATLTLLCDAMAFPRTLCDGILRHYFLSQV